MALCLFARDVIVTTPHGCKPGASGMTRVCRPTPVVRFMHTSETKLTATCVSHGTCRRLGRSCFYPRELTLEPANTIELSVCKRTTQTFFCEKTKVESVLRLRAARLSSPCVNAGVFRRGLVSPNYTRKSGLPYEIPRARLHIHTHWPSVRHGCHRLR
jgi:hypothetical protein